MSECGMQAKLTLHEQSLPPSLPTSKALRSSVLQLRPIGEMLSMPVRYSMKVPRLIGMSRSGGKEREGGRGGRECEQMTCASRLYIIT
jgi:hypothetical protein